VLGNQGACVIAKSYEMKAMGVKTGMPIWDAAKVCPNGIYVKRDFRWYEAISRRILEATKLASPHVEYYSIDEMFFDGNHLEQVMGQPLLTAARSLQQQILEQIGVPVSMGISLTKTLAKLISDTAKPFGCAVVLDGTAIQELLDRTPVGEMSGIGKRSEQKLADHGILNCSDYAKADRRLIRKLLTVKGEHLWWELHGTPTQPILTRRPAHKCISRGGSLGGATADPERLIAWAVRNVERLIEELDYYEVFTSQVTLALELKAGGGWAGRAALPHATAAFLVIAPAVKELLVDAIQSNQQISGMHLLAEKLVFRSLVQKNLFEECDPRMESIAKTKALINQRVGRFALRGGDTLALNDIYADESNEYDICDVHGKMCF
jgi:nucleotidyltransferase/DNA polymerase involved in DNA repair